MLLPELREEVLEANLALPREGLVAMTSGNASARDPERGLVVIKPSGVPYGRLRAESLVVVDLDGEVVDGELRPSIDTTAHLEVYRRRDDVGGVIHTHSPYATSFAIREEPLLPYLTAVADEFGGPVPCTDEVVVGGAALGRAAVEANPTGEAVLLRRHGVLTFSHTVDEALRAAVMLEECAKATAIAASRGPIEPIDPAVVAAARTFHLDNYGQATRTAG